MAYKEYKVIHVMEGGLGTVFLGSSGLPLEKLEVTLEEIEKSENSGSHNHFR